MSAQSFRDIGQMVECCLTNKVVVGYRLIAVTSTSDFATVPRNELVNIETRKDYGFNQKFVRDMKKTYS